MIQPEFAVEPQMCDGGDEETPSAVWFCASGLHAIIVLCPTCCSALMFTSMHHPKAERLVNRKP